MTDKSFSPYEWRAFYYGKMSREEAARLLCQSHITVGTFLLRDSSRAGDYSLSVRESEDAQDPKAVRHYLIEQVVDDELNHVVKVANQTFPDIPMLLNHYKMRLLENCSLTMPFRNLGSQRVMGLWRFVGEGEDELSFAAGDELEVLAELGGSWLSVKDAIGRCGRVPANYVGKPEYTTVTADKNVHAAAKSDVDLSTLSPFDSDDFEPVVEVSLPSWGLVMFNWTARVYDDRFVSLVKDSIVRVTSVDRLGYAHGTAFPADYIPSEEEADSVEEEDSSLARESPNGQFVERSCYFRDMSKKRTGMFPLSAVQFIPSVSNLSRKKAKRELWADSSQDSSNDNGETLASSLRQSFDWR